jgi:hypothetical protein
MNLRDAEARWRAGVERSNDCCSPCKAPWVVCTAPALPSVEAGETMRVGGKMRRHPVQDDADAGAVHGIDETRKAFGRAITRARREKSERLVAPGAAEPILCDREKLHMGEPHVGHVRARSLSPMPAYGRAYDA